MAEIVYQEGIPQLDKDAHWINSASTLCHYTKKQEYLDEIIINKALIPRYVIEQIEYLGLNEISKICFPMTCFCDIPFSRVKHHMSRYGEYGIALDKKTVLKKYQIQPIQYINNKSSLTKDFVAAIQTGLALRDVFQGEARKPVNYLCSALMYMKPVWGYEKNREGNNEICVYQDECEWRYVPNSDFPEEIRVMLNNERATNKAVEKYSIMLRNHPECWMQYEWSDVCYIVVPNANAVQHTVDTIKKTIESNEIRDELIEKIVISKGFAS